MHLNNHKLNILSWNAQSISNKTKIFELELLLRDLDIQVACIQETYLNPGVRVHLENYVLYRNDRLSHGGGVAIAVRRNIEHKLLTISNTTVIENISIEIKLNQKPITISSVYNPQPSNHFINDLKILTNNSNETLLFGDLNAKHSAWKCASSDLTGKSLHDFIENSEYVIYAPDEHTHFPHSGATPSTIDILISNSSLPIADFRAVDKLISDHRPIACQLDARHQKVTTKSFRYDLANWKKYRTFIQRADLSLNTDSTDNIDASVNHLSDIIRQARDVATPTATHRDALLRIAPDTLNAIKYKYKLNRLWQRCQVEADKTALRSAANIAAKLVKDLVRRDRNAKWSRFMHQIDGSSKKLWRVSRSLRGKRGTTPNILWHNDNKLITNGEKANAFAAIFETAHGVTANFTHPHDAKVERFTTRFRQNGPYSSFPRITHDELSHAIETLRPFKAPGVDGIQNVLLKNLPENALDGILKLFNACIEFNHWPSSFKEAKVIPIPKPGKDAGKSSNYRPISLLNTLGKLFEKIINVRIMSFAEENNILNEEQFGFRPQHSTSHQILRVTRHIRRNWALRKSTGMVLFDIEKAFDSVWHDGLIFKLHKFGFPNYLCALIREFTSNRSFRVHVMDQQSRLGRIDAGVPQGSILSPGLYSIYVSDLKVDPLSDTACYADDTSVYSSANRSGAICRRLQKSLNRIEHFFNKWKIKINPVKTQAVFFPFDNRKKRLPTIQLTLNGIPITFTKSVKYLGVTLDQKLRFTDHINDTRARATRCMSALYPLIGRGSLLSIRNKLLLYKTIIRPIITYASPIWCSTAMTNRKHLQILQNKCLKIILKLHWRTPTTEVHERANLKTIADYISDLNNNFNTRCQFSDYIMIRELSQ